MRPAGAARQEKTRRGASADRLKKRMSRLALEAADCLEEIMTDGDAKAADRIAAAKLTFEVYNRQGQIPEPADSSIRVIFEDMPREFAE